MKMAIWTKLERCGRILRHNLERWYRIFSFRLKESLTKIYTVLRIEKIKFFLAFLFHRYHVNQFNPVNIESNIKVFARLQPRDWMTTTNEGKVFILKSKYQKFWFRLRNLLLFGAPQKRIEKVVFYTYVTITLELYNPFTKKVLAQFLERKIAFLKHMLKKIKKINGRLWDQTQVLHHVDVYRRNSLIQDLIIDSMVKAVKRQQEPAIVKEAKKGLKKGYNPILSIIGVSGAYWMRGPNREILGLFKPYDEEIHAPNNPMGPVYQGAMGQRKTRWGCRVGESPHHEVAAFVVDEFLGFGIVPRTCYASFTHNYFYLAKENPTARIRMMKTKLGSFQEFLEGFDSLSKVTREEASEIPLGEFQLLLVLDVIIGNSDRNQGNILVGDQKIAAIDHGLCFPDKLEELSNWYWSSFGQGSEPLYPSLVDLLNNFPFDALAHKLNRKCFISLNALNRIRERVALFTAGINAGSVPKDLEELMRPEHLEPLVDRKQTLKAAAEEQVQNFLSSK